MRNLLLLMTAVVCGSAFSAPKLPKPFTNGLGMKFLPVPGTKVQFSIWETREKDFEAYMKANKLNKFDFNILLKSRHTQPVCDVSWHDAQRFCAWLTKEELAWGKIKAGQKYRLPTDAEWSVAVGLGKEKGNTPREKHKGIKGVYPWGKEWPPPEGAGNYSQSWDVDSFERRSPVGSFKANKFGLHDMGGNVWEWCEDMWDPATGPRANPEHPDYVPPDRTLRGACWSSWGSMLSSNRNYASPSARSSRLVGSFGFRCVLTNAE